MSFAGLDGEVHGSLVAAGGTPAQVLAIQRILETLEPNTYASKYAASLRGLETEVLQAAHALESMHTGQPSFSLAKALCQGAIQACSRAVPFYSNTSAPQQIATLLGHVLLVPNSQAKRPNELAKFKMRGRLVSTLVPRLSAELHRLFLHIWRQPAGTQTNWNMIDYVATEVACILATEDRDRHALQEDIIRSLRSGGTDGPSMWAALLPPQRAFYYATVVFGANRLEGLSKLAPGAGQLSGKDRAPLYWGPANHQLKQWLARISIPSHAVVVSIKVHAVDRPSAGRLGRRQLTEVLDQYMAGHRTLDLSLDNNSFVCAVGEDKPASHVYHPRKVNKAYPLVYRWPQGLRESLRSAHLAKTTASPLAATAMAYAALEAAGLNERSELAGALALQALRQQINGVHQALVQDLGAQEATKRNELARLQNRQRQLQRGAAHISVDYADDEHMVDRLKILQVDISASTKQLNNIQIGSVLRQDISKYVLLDKHGYLHDLNLWYDVLTPQRTGEPASLTLAREALHQLPNLLTPLMIRELAVWQHRLAVPGDCAEWLELTTQRMKSLLDSMYFARNRSFHSGQFSGSGVATLGQGAVLLVDMTLEFLGNWYRHDLSDPGKSPATIVATLERRRAAIIQDLRTLPSPAYGLNISRLTSASGSNPWRR